MNNKYYPSLICGFSAAVITTIPGAKSLACCLFLPVAAAASIYLYRRSINTFNRMNTGTGILLGFFTGVFAAIFSTGFEVLITYLTKANELVNNFPEVESLINKMNLGEAAKQSIDMIREMTTEIQSKGFSLLFTFMILISNIISYIIFGIVGGVVSTAIINSRVKISK